MTFLIYDTAINSVHTLLQLQHVYRNNQSLFKGTKDEMLIDVAPYIFEIDEEFAAKMSHGIDISLNGIIIVESGKNLATLCEHFRQFIYQKIKGREYFFRFWDGRYLQRFLPTCEEIQLRQFFGPVTAYVLETADNDSQAKRFSLDQVYQLKTETAIAERVYSVFAFKQSKRETVQ